MKNGTAADIPEASPPLKSPWLEESSPLPTCSMRLPRGVPTKTPSRLEKPSKLLKMNGGTISTRTWRMPFWTTWMRCCGSKPKQRRRTGNKGEDVLKNVSPPSYELSGAGVVPGKDARFASTDGHFSLAGGSVPLRYHGDGRGRIEIFVLNRQPPVRISVRWMSSPSFTRWASSFGKALCRLT